MENREMNLLSLINLWQNWPGTSLKYGFCSRPLKKFVFATTHSKTMVIWCRTLHLLLYSVLIESHAKRQLYPCLPNIKLPHASYSTAHLTLPLHRRLQGVICAARG